MVRTTVGPTSEVRSWDLNQDQSEIEGCLSFKVEVEDRDKRVRLH
jgi:hypothetical protein